MGIDPASAAPESSLCRRFNFIDDLPVATGRSALEPVLCQVEDRTSGGEYAEYVAQRRALKWGDPAGSVCRSAAGRRCGGP